VKLTEYSIKCSEFQGPVTLLLDLIRKKKIDIYQVRLSDIIQDFINYVKHNRSVLLDTLSGFLYIITILLEIKSGAVIPSYNREKPDEEEEPDLFRLQQRERIYLVYKKAVNYILKRKEMEAIYYIREAPVEPQFMELLPDFLNNLNIDNLNFIASKLIRKDEFTIDFSQVHIEDATITVMDAIIYIRKTISNRPEISFRELADNYELLVDKIVCFLSILELYKNEIIDILQFENFGNIIIKKAKKF
jgi:segregation and condensation protein A